MASRRNRFRATLVVSVGLVAAGVAACGGGAKLTASNRPAPAGAAASTGFSRFPDLPIPRGAEMDLDRSLVLGAKDEWIGRLAIKVSSGAGALYDFYNREMPRFGWSEVTTVRGGTSVLTYTRGGRVATVQIRGRTLWGSAVDVTISPHGRPPPGVGTAQAR